MHLPAYFVWNPSAPLNLSRYHTHGFLFCLSHRFLWKEPRGKRINPRQKMVPLYSTNQKPSPTGMHTTTRSTPHGHHQHHQHHQHNQHHDTMAPVGSLGSLVPKWQVGGRFASASLTPYQSKFLYAICRGMRCIRSNCRIQSSWMLPPTTLSVAPHLKQVGIGFCLGI